MERQQVRKIAPFGLRMQPFLRRKVEEAAKSNFRSQNAEIHERLERSFEADKAEEQSAKK